MRRRSSGFPRASIRLTGVADLGAACVQDTEVFYDLKRLLEDSNADIPPQLARHEAAKNKPGTVGDKPRREQITYAA